MKKPQPLGCAAEGVPQLLRASGMGRWRRVTATYAGLSLPGGSGCQRDGHQESLAAPTPDGPTYPFVVRSTFGARNAVRNPTIRAMSDTTNARSHQMVTHHPDRSVSFSDPGTTGDSLDLHLESTGDHSTPSAANEPVTVDIAVTEWATDLSISGSSALGTRTTHPARGAATLVAATGYVDYDAIDSIHESPAACHQAAR